MQQTQTYWNKIFKTAKELLELKPWEFLYETDLFGIKIPGKDDEYYISVMGNAGEVFALSAYQGRGTIGQFFQFIDEYSYTAPEELLLMQQVMLSFENQAALEEIEKKTIKSTKLSFPKDKTPNLRETIPGFVPKIPGEERLHDIAIIFEQALNVIKRAKDNIDIILPEDEEKVLIREKQPGKGGRWVEKFQKLSYQGKVVEAKLDINKVERLKKLQKKSQAIIIDVKLLPHPTLNEDNQAFFPFLLLFMDKKSQMIEHYELLEPKPSYEAMLSSVPAKILDFLIQMPAKPYSIDARQGVIGEAINELGKKTNIKVHVNKILPEINEAMEWFLESQGE